MPENPSSDSDRLEEALSRGAAGRLPPNQPKGLLGERGVDLYKVDSFEPDLNAGVSQENDGPVVRIAVVLAFLLFPPVGYWLLWKTDVFTRTQTYLVGILGTAWLFLVAWLVLIR